MNLPDLLIILSNEVCRRDFLKKKIILLVVLAVALTSLFGFSAYGVEEEATTTAAFIKINFVNAVVTAQELNVRTGPSTSYPVVCVLKQGQVVKVFGMLGDWYCVYEPTKGCVGAASSKYLKSTAAAPGTTAKPQVPTVTAKPGTVATPKPGTVATPKPGAVATPKPGTGTGTPQGVSAEEQQMLELVNKARASAGVKPLAFDTELQKVARLKAQDMVEKNYFSHQSPTYGSPFDMMRQFGISFKSAGENIAGNQTVQGAFNAWMNSEGHKQNILNGNFNYTGIGIVPSKTYGKIFVQQFIGR
jgi:uncharacterized YkwD family protein